jgi:hypothetical protein
MRQNRRVQRRLARHDLVMKPDLLDTPKSRAVSKRVLAPRALATTLHAEPAFLAHAREVARDPHLDAWIASHPDWGSQFEPPWPDVASRLAAGYWRGGEGRRVVAVFLRAAAEGLRIDPDDTAVALAAMGGLSSATWDPTARLADSDQPNRPGERFFDLIWTGARVIAWRGAGRCAGCDLGPLLAGGGRRGRERRTFCGACEIDQRALQSWTEHAAAQVLKRCRYLLGPDPMNVR